MSAYIEERIYYPSGADPDDWNDRVYQIGVYWRGNGKWMVATSREGHRQLSRTGRWLFLPLKMTAMRWCRFDFETACALAAKHVDDYRINGKTWADYDAWRRERT